MYYYVYGSDVYIYIILSILIDIGACPADCIVAGQVTNVVRSCFQSSLALKQAGTSCRDAIG